MFREEITHHKDSLVHHDPENPKTLKIYEYLLFGATLIRLTFTREYFIGHKKYRSAVGCKSLRSYEGSGSPSRRVSQEGIPGEKGRIRKDAKEESHGSRAT